jgi:L-ascorbate 6-phosphate lactonase
MKIQDHLTERAVVHLSITWYGQAGFRLDAAGSRVLIDIFLGAGGDRRYPPPVTVADLADATLVLCTHEHTDHMDLDFLAKFCVLNGDAKIVVPAPVLDHAAGAGLARDRLIGAVRGEQIRDRDVTVHPIAALHGVGDGKPVVYEFLDGRFLGYLVEAGGLRIFHAGDGLVYPELVPALRALAPDVLLLPINGRDHMRESAGLVGNMNEAEAAWLTAEVKPRYVIPMHYEMFSANRGDVAKFAALINAQHDAAPHGGPVLVIPPRNHPFTLS